MYLDVISLYDFLGYELGKKFVSMDIQCFNFSSLSRFPHYSHLLPVLFIVLQIGQYLLVTKLKFGITINYYDRPIRRIRSKCRFYEWRLLHSREAVQFCIPEASLSQVNYLPVINPSLWSFRMIRLGCRNMHLGVAIQAISHHRLREEQQSVYLYTLRN